MPSKKRPGVVGVYVELPEEQDRRLRALAERLGLGGITDHIRMAIDRHLANPPALAVPPLSPVTVHQPPAKARASRTRSRGGGP
jgi:hypothetical protein